MRESSLPKKHAHIILSMSHAILCNLICTDLIICIETTHTSGDPFIEAGNSGWRKTTFLGLSLRKSKGLMNPFNIYVRVFLL